MLLSVYSCSSYYKLLYKRESSFFFLLINCCLSWSRDYFVSTFFCKSLICCYFWLYSYRMVSYFLSMASLLVSSIWYSSSFYLMGPKRLLYYYSWLDNCFCSFSAKLSSVLLSYCSRWLSLSDFICSCMSIFPYCLYFCSSDYFSSTYAKSSFWMISSTFSSFCYFLSIVLLQLSLTTL